MSDTFEYYWFYKLSDSEPLWTPFSIPDCKKLETVYLGNSECKKVAVKGGRYDADIEVKFLIPVYWDAPNGLVKRFKWFRNKKEIHDEESSQILKTFNPSIDSDESDHFDHVCFIVHGIGESCDLQLRSILDCTNSFKKKSNEIISANLSLGFKNDQSQEFNSIEFLPISWHDVIHSDKNKWKDISLPSIPNLRLFSNTAISDMIFYANVEFRRKIMEKVVDNLNKYVKIFKERNPYYRGKISLIGHSLGSLILFDLLSTFMNEPTESNFEFKVDNFFAIGSPIAFFLTTRGVNLADSNLKLNCDCFFNIFHQLDPFAYRIEPMVRSEMLLEPIQLSKYNLELQNLLWGMLSLNRSGKNQHIRVTNNEYMSDDESLFNYQQICKGFENNSRLKRIDFAIEKSAFDHLDYLLFLTAHSSYWDSYDLVLFILKQLYYQVEIEENRENITK
ncbi:SEC23-interacting isoform X2 [Brachionus plicatilis]|uniref:SEC23-interacting isoform X2 n=1 Tax=Brachionus plicatilis TaxID=10195 RepID=A0A3M7QHS9_BRAPC|nr:SEC23-interacting isoform X2 [Brachionus plicatilis]